MNSPQNFHVLKERVVNAALGSRSTSPVFIEHLFQEGPARTGSAVEEPDGFRPSLVGLAVLSERVDVRLERGFEQALQRRPVYGSRFAQGYEAHVRQEQARHENVVGHSVRSPFRDGFCPFPCRSSPQSFRQIHLCTFRFHSCFAHVHAEGEVSEPCFYAFRDSFVYVSEHYGRRSQALMEPVTSMHVRQSFYGLPANVSYHPPTSRERSKWI
mmetsp:Transcript_10216/g.62335  ORF Transcript_10216/g.62335 Transcript_10216/m.62335 type:complete len:213 (-) Transcript_10216:819-1457(-)